MKKYINALNNKTESSSFKWKITLVCLFASLRIDAWFDWIRIVYAPSNSQPNTTVEKSHRSHIYYYYSSSLLVIIIQNFCYFLYATLSVSYIYTLHACDMSDNVSKWLVLKELFHFSQVLFPHRLFQEENNRASLLLLKILYFYLVSDNKTY